MAETFLLEVVSPSKLLISEEVDEFTAPGAEGEFGVLFGHTPFLTALKAGELSYKKGGTKGSIAVSRGYAEVLPDKTTILVDDAKSADEIDINAAKDLLEKSIAALSGLEPDDPKYQTATAGIEYAEAQIGIKQK